EQATATEHMVIAPIGFIVQAIPISPGGVGVGEAAFAGLYKLCGRPQSQGVIARLSLRVVEWIVGLVGVVIYLRMKSHHALPEESDEEEPGAADGQGAEAGRQDPKQPGQSSPEKGV